MRAGPGAEDREGMNGAVTDSSQVCTLPGGGWRESFHSS